MSRNRLDELPERRETASTAGASTKRNGGGLKPIEINPEKNRRVAGWIGYLLMFAAVAGVLVAVFARFTASVAWAVTLVTFMIGYMVLMGWLAARNPEQGRRGRR